MAGKNGGARPGAGRKPNAEKYARPIAAAEKKIADRLPHIVDKLLELGEGVQVQRETEDGPVIYTTIPDRQALQYMTDRIMGKPKDRGDQHITHTGGVTVYLPSRKVAE